MTGSTSASIQAHMAKRHDNMKALGSGAITDSRLMIKLKYSIIRQNFNEWLLSAVKKHACSYDHQ